MNTLAKLSDTLNELMLLNGLTEQSLADKSGIPISCISSYVRGSQAPYLDTLVKLAECFNCSIDYLLGRTDKACEKTYNNPVAFAQRFKELLKTNDCLSYSETFGKMDISKSSFYEWKRGKSLPTLDKLVKLAEFFDCSVDFLSGREK
ncbi:MAG: transcriptional regulator [Clostridia bacterium]|nr:transcriptional regulator [Clostridia bacterium]